MLDHRRSDWGKRIENRQTDEAFFGTLSFFLLPLDAPIQNIKTANMWP